MRKHWKFLMLIMAALALVLAACGGGGTAEEDTPEPDEPEEEATEAPEVPEDGGGGEEAAAFSLCLVTDVGRVNDGTFNQFAYEGMVRAAEDFGLENTFIETQSQADYATNLQSCVDEGYNIVITVGFLIADATLEAAQANPDVYFIGIDQFFVDHPENLVGVQFREDQAGFLAGALAAQMTESGIVAGVYGIDIPPVIKFRNGFEQGVRYIDPGIQTLGVYIDDFVAPDRGASAAEQFMGEGADVIFGAGGPTGSGGILRAAEEGVLVIGVDQDEYITTFGNGDAPGAENIISSATKRVDNGVYLNVKALVEGGGQWQGGSLFIGSAANEGVGFAPAHDSDVPEEVTASLEEILTGLASGSIQTGVDPVTGDLVDIPDLTGETITFYHFGDISGPYAGITGPLVHGFEDAVGAINDSGGIFGATIELQFRDTGGSVDEAVAAYEAFTSEDDNVMVMFTYGSGDGEALATRFAEDQIPNLAAGLSATAFYGEGSGYTFGYGPIYPDQFGLFLSWLSDNWDEYKPEGAGDEIKVAYISWPTAYGQGALTDESRAYAAELGIEIVAEELIDVSPTADTTSALFNAQAAGANVIYTNTLAFGPAGILNSLYDLGIRDEFVFGANNWAMDLATYAYLNDPTYADGMIGIFPYLWWSDADNPGVQYAESVFAANDRPAAEHGVGYLLTLGGVDLATTAIRNAILDVGFENLTGEVVTNHIVALGKHNALRGVMRFDFSGDNRSPHQAQIRIAGSQPGEFIVIQDWTDTPDLRPR